MLSINDLKPGVIFILDGQPYQVLSANHLKMQMRKPVLQTRIKNLINGKVMEKNLQHSENFEEAEIEKSKVEYLYNHRGEYWFCKADDPSQRFSLTEDVLADNRHYLKPHVPIEAFKFQGRIIAIALPIKMDFQVVEAPPNIRGNTAQGGTKIATIESGAKISVPLFIEEGDIIKVNTERGEYVERSQKG